MSRFTQTETSLVIWLKIVTIVAWMSAFCLHTCAKIPTPLVIVNDRLVDVMQNIQQMLLYFNSVLCTRDW